MGTPVVDDWSVLQAAATRQTIDGKPSVFHDNDVTNHGRDRDDRAWRGGRCVGCCAGAGKVEISLYYPFLKTPRLGLPHVFLPGGAVCQARLPQHLRVFPSDDGDVIVYPGRIFRCTNALLNHYCVSRCGACCWFFYTVWNNSWGKPG